MPKPRGPGVLRRLAALLIRGPEAAFILADLDDAMERELARGIPLWRARWRYAVNVFGSAFSVWRTRWRMPNLGMSWLDVKLGLRMLVKQPGLTCAAVFALAIGIPVGLYPTHLMNVLEAPLPVDEGDRIYMLRYLNVATSRAEAPSLQDFMHWREELTTFEAVGAATIGASYNVISEDGRAAPVQGAEVTASMFNILRVRPQLGRTLISADEAISAPKVVVIGHDLWQSRLGGDPDVVGRTIRIGGVLRTVVGVMPEEFLFPLRDNLWLPLRVNVLADEEGQERAHTIFGRLSDGISSEEAQAELTAVGRRMAIEFPETHARLQPEVVPLTIGLGGLRKGGLRADPEFYAFQGLALLVLVVACANVGMLIFARTAARSSELAVCTALGASRTRVISQLFTEALLLAVLSAGVGLLIADRIILSRIAPARDKLPLPYWLDFGVTPDTVFWALSLAVFSAAVVGVVPALKVTGKAVQRNIPRTAAGRSGIRFGGMSSALIIADVALAVATVGVAVAFSYSMTEFRDGMGNLSAQFLSAELTIPRAEGTADAAPSDPTEFTARVGATQQELIRRLMAEPGIRGVAVGSMLPGMDHPWGRVELDDENQSDDVRRYSVSTARIDPDFFNALQHPILSGRGFNLADLGEDRSAVIVNTDFVDRVLGGRNPIGRRVRYATRADEEPGPWYEIVGVVGPLGTLMTNSDPPWYVGLYHPLAPGEINSLRIAIHVGDDPESFTPRLRALTSEVDPTAIISEPVALNEVFSFTQFGTKLVVWGAGIVVGILIALSASGIYALMSFTVTERTREIGVRTALGAQRSSIVLTVARRALAQLGVGILLGTSIAGVLFFQMEGFLGQHPIDSPLVLTLIVGVSVMVLIGVPACTAPTLRALRIMPIEALRES